MAKTFDTLALSWEAPFDAYHTFATVLLPQAASQTHAAFVPVKNASGYVAEWVSVGDADILGFTHVAGSNGTAGQYNTEVTLALPEITVEANFLGSAAADNVLAAADLFSEVGLTKSATLLGASAPGWYFEDGGTGALIVAQFITAPSQFSTTLSPDPAAGDTNARLRARVKPGVSLWF